MWVNSSPNAHLVITTVSDIFIKVEWYFHEMQYEYTSTESYLHWNRVELIILDHDAMIHGCL